jgi:hypothetical protein
MGAKAFAGLHKIIIEGKQGSEGRFGGIAIVTKRKKEIALKPADVFYTSFVGSEQLYVHRLGICLSG